MADVHVEPVLTASDRRRFLDLPYRLYRDHPHWVAPLRVEQRKLIDPDKNAFFDHSRMQLFLAENAAGTPVGRIAAIVNGMHLETHEDATGFFGFFEAIDDYTVAQALLDRAKNWLQDQGLTAMRGPTNPSMTDTAGLLVDGFDRRPAFLMPYNPAYYPEFFARYGLESAMSMWAYYVHEKYYTGEVLARGARLVRRRYPEIAVRTIDMDNLDREVEIVRRIYNDAWADNWGHVPVTSAEFEQLANDLEQVISPELGLIMELDDDPVAFAVTLPNLNEVLQYITDGRLLPLGLPKLLLYTNLFQIRSCRMALMGVQRVHQGKGFSSVLILEAIHHLLDAGYRDCEMSWVLDSNAPMKKILDAIGAVQDKKYAMYEMSFHGSNTRDHPSEGPA
jgi:GNAT superfamily N-acetyltransferase